MSIQIQLILWLISIIYTDKIIAAPDTFCLWDKPDATPAPSGGTGYPVNGEYKLGEIVNEKYYYTMSPTLGSDCSPKSYSIYYKENDFWGVSLDVDFGSDALTCLDGVKAHALPNRCTNWDGNKVGYVSAGSCPVWPCDRISVGAVEHITSPCNQQFVKIADNVYQGLTSTTIYMWFHPRTFKWFCNKIVNQEDCYVLYGGSDVVSAPFQNWHDFTANAEQWTWATESHGDFLVTCQFETPSPAPAATNYPTPPTPTTTTTTAPTTTTTTPVPTTTTTTPAPTTSTTNTPAPTTSTTGSWTTSTTAPTTTTTSTSTTPAPTTNTPTTTTTTAPTTSTTTTPAPTTTTTTTPTPAPTTSTTTTTTPAPTTTTTTPAPTTTTTTLAPITTTTTTTTPPPTTSTTTTRAPTTTTTTTTTPTPTNYPTLAPTKNPTPAPTKNPTPAPTKNPSKYPSKSPTQIPSKSPIEGTASPTNPTSSPTRFPTPAPPMFPTPAPTDQPSDSPTPAPTNIPSEAPIIGTPSPTRAQHPSFTPKPTSNTQYPTLHPSSFPTKAQTDTPTPAPTNNPLTDGQAGERTTSEGDNDGLAVSNTQSNNMLPIIIAIISAAICICIGIIIFIYKKKKPKSFQKGMEMQRVTSMSTPQVNGEGGIDAQSIDIYSNNNALRMWLSNIDLEQYIDLFEKQGFAAKVTMLYELEDNDLEKIGIIKMADRKAILKQIQLTKTMDVNDGEIYNDTNVVTTPQQGLLMQMETGQIKQACNDDVDDEDLYNNQIETPGIVRTPTGEQQIKLSVHDSPVLPDEEDELLYAKPENNGTPQFVTPK